MMKGLMGRCLNHETTLGQVREKARLMEDELIELKNWKLAMEQTQTSRTGQGRVLQADGGFEESSGRQEKEVRQAKEVAMLEYRDSNALLSELEVSYNDGFDDALRQVKALYPKLDVSSVNINVPKQISVQPTQSEDTNELFRDDFPITNAPVDVTIEGE